MSAVINWVFTRNYWVIHVDVRTPVYTRIRTNTPAMPRIPQGTLHTLAGFLFQGVVHV
jgi:hypothetical protein